MLALFLDKADQRQIENPNDAGNFIAVEPIKDAIVLDVGDLLQRWSNGLLATLPHYARFMKRFLDMCMQIRSNPQSTASRFPQSKIVTQGTMN